jgi:hypothetical protein
MAGQSAPSQVVISARIDIATPDTILAESIMLFVAVHEYRFLLYKQ